MMGWGRCGSSSVRSGVGSAGARTVSKPLPIAFSAVRMGQTLDR